jgi:hypothetical protein
MWRAPTLSYQHINKDTKAHKQLCPLSPSLPPSLSARQPSPHHLPHHIHTHTHTHTGIKLATPHPITNNNEGFLPRNHPLFGRPFLHDQCLCPPATIKWYVCVCVYVCKYVCVCLSGLLHLHTLISRRGQSATACWIDRCSYFTYIHTYTHTHTHTHTQPAPFSSKRSEHKAMSR